MRYIIAKRAEMLDARGYLRALEFLEDNFGDRSLSKEEILRFFEEEWTQPAEETFRFLVKNKYLERVV